MKKLIAMICVLAMVLSLTVSAFAAVSPGLYPIWSEVEDSDDDSSSDDSSSDSSSSKKTDATDTAAAETAPAAAEGPVVLDPSTLDLTKYESILPEPVPVEQAGLARVIVPQLIGRTDLDQLLLTVTDANGNTVYMNMGQFADTFDAATGAITLNFPTAGQFDILAPIA